MRVQYLMAAVILAAVVAGYAGERIIIRGSDTMVILGQRWAEEFMRQHPGDVVEVAAGGSGSGFAALINGTADICFASRPMQQWERDLLDKKYGTRGIAIPCAVDGLSVYVHPDNPVPSLSLLDLRALFSGAVSNWRVLGGPDADVVLYGRERHSGTHQMFREVILGDTAYAPGMLGLPSTAAVVLAVRKDPHGIGYGGVAYGKGIREIAVRRDSLSPAFAPLPENIRDGSYPISRLLYMYLKAPPAGLLRDFVDWVLSERGQQLVSAVGYLPLR